MNRFRKPNHSVSVILHVYGNTTHRNIPIANSFDPYDPLCTSKAVERVDNSTEHLDDLRGSAT